MQYKKPEYMKEILDYVDRFYGLHHRSPSCSEIARNTTLNRSAVHSYLVAMNEQGKIEYNGQTILTPGIRAMQNGIKQVGIVGSIACGLPTDAEERIEEYISLPTSLIGDGEMYILYASGESMIEAGIDDGDMVLVRKQEEARDGDIVVAYVEGEGNTLKRLFLEDGFVTLHPENKAMQDIHVDNCRIQGIAVWVFKKVS